MRFGAAGMAPALAAARRDDMEAAMRISGRAILGRNYYRNLSQSRLQQVQANTIRAELLGSGFPPLDDESVRGIQAPTLLVTGHDSPRIFHLLIDRLEELMPCTQKTDIPRASHIMHEDNSPAYNTAVLSFLAGHRTD